MLVQHTSRVDEVLHDEQCADSALFLFVLQLEEKERKPARNNNTM
jgi:hypothetical protein